MILVRRIYPFLVPLHCSLFSFPALRGLHLEENHPTVQRYHQNPFKLLVALSCSTSNVHFNDFFSASFPVLSA